MSLTDRAVKHPLNQRGRRFKRVILRPVGPTALRIGQSRWPTSIRDVILRKVALPYLRARDDRFERRVGDGVFVGQTADLLGLYVRVFGVWEPHLSAFIAGRLGPGDVFIDVGANSGWYTLLAALRVRPRGAVVAVEPSVGLLERLGWQLERNALTNVRVVPEAVSDHVGRVAVEPGPAEHTGLTKALREAEDASSDAVPCRPLREMVSDDEWARVRLVKIDVEGAEFAAIRGMAQYLRSLPAQTEVIVEVGPARAERPGDVADLFASFRDAGFSAYEITNDYDVRGYLECEPAAGLRRLDPSAITAEVNVVFSRTDGDILPVAHGRSDGLVAR